MSQTLNPNKVSNCSATNTSSTVAAMSTTEQEYNSENNIPQANNTLDNNHQHLINTSVYILIFEMKFSKILATNVCYGTTLFYGGQLGLAKKNHCHKLANNRLFFH